MINRNYHKESFLILSYEEKILKTFQNIRSVKKYIHCNGIAGTVYNVSELCKETGEIYNSWAYKFTGQIIFTKQTYSKWKEEIAKVKKNQLTIAFY